MMRNQRDIQGTLSLVCLYSALLLGWWWIFFFLIGAADEGELKPLAS